MMKIVYHDEDYPTHWIEPAISQCIARYLSGRGFKIYDANELYDFIIKSISEDTASRSIIVFSQDVVPDIIFKDKFFDKVICKTLLSQYLYQGGKVIWIGDIPFWFRGRRKCIKDIIWPRLPMVNILGIIPLITYSTLNQVKIKEEGKQRGLSEPWHGIRPILPTDEDLIVLAESTSLVAWPIPLTYFKINLRTKDPEILMAGDLELIPYFIERPRPPIVIPRNSARKLEINIEEEIYEAKPANTVLIQRKLPNAWIKKLGRGEFIRIWDCPISEDFIKYFEKKMLPDLYNLAVNTIISQ